MILYDTCSLLNAQKKAFKNEFYISSITLKELENIKTASYKDEETKYKARKIVNLLAEKEDSYKVIPYKFEAEREDYDLPDTNDGKIITTAAVMAEELDEPVIFMTEDLCCYHLAKIIEDYLPNFNARYSVHKEKKEYQGFKEITLTDKELANFYSVYGDPSNNQYNLLINEYLIIKNTLDEIVDQYRYTENGLKPVPFASLKSPMFGDIKPKDIYQRIAVDSLKTNQITVLRGKAGSGKSLLGLAYLFNLLDKGKIDKIIMFVNPVATKDSCKFGFLPGDLLEKILGSQIGNFLASKLGDIEAVYELVNAHKLQFVALADARGFDTTGMNCGLYMTEAQNTNINMMKLLLSRIGENTICVIEGDDDTQTDMISYEGKNNGLKRLCEVYKGESYFGCVSLQTCYRSKIAEKAMEM